MKHKKHWSAFVLTTMSLIVTVPPSFVATDSRKIVIEVGPLGATPAVVVTAQSGQASTWVLQITL
ncbi:hypothetical protein [Alicyclobacillus sp. ALC3]|uniref:hypothetical protein n=1 Tax=Alicyclobacillus sp. ALC3 TaxID=2796143 RepID=UPI002378B7BA|nr:hypothetical protein [Alicyclobacillus sp. ALC3]WDL96356.1 hypothetical protein JC200_18830 [Alicyclobacillus sp. ALC3]